MKSVNMSGGHEASQYFPSCPHALCSISDMAKVEGNTCPGYFGLRWSHCPESTTRQCAKLTKKRRTNGWGWGGRGLRTFAVVRCRGSQKKKIQFPRRLSLSRETPFLAADSQLWLRSGVCTEKKELPCINTSSGANSYRVSNWNPVLLYWALIPKQLFFLV